MKSFLQDFENGKVLELASDIGADDNVLSDISYLFSVAYSSLWNKEIGIAEIEKLKVDYSFVKETNKVLNCTAHSKMKHSKVDRKIGICYVFP